MNNKAKILSNILLKNNMKLSVAESFTGGKIASMLVSIPGTSMFLNEGIVAYSNQAKVKRLFVSENTLNTYGAVSEQTACEMVKGLLKTFDSDICIATTGNAGPTAEKTGEEGQYFIAVGNRENIIVKKYYLNGDRQQVIDDGVLNAFNMTIDFIEKNCKR